MGKEPRRYNREAVVVATKRNDGNVHVTAKQLKLPLRFVRFWWNRYLETGCVDDHKRTGRPSMLSEELVDVACELLEEHQSVPHVTQEMVKRGLLRKGTHRSTVYRAIKHSTKGMVCHAEQHIPFISAAAKVKRVQFAQAHLSADTDWGKVLAIDSCIFRTHKIGGKRRVWTRAGASTKRAVPLHPLQLHVYGGICAFGKTDLVHATGTTGMKSKYLQKGVRASGVVSDEYCDIMADGLVPDAEELFGFMGVGDWQVLQDKAPVHTSAMSKAWLVENEVRVIPNWPSTSPDLNPIENVWGWMKQRIGRQRLTTMAQLKAAVQEAWEAVPETMLHNLMHGMKERMHKVVAADGEHIGK